MNQSKKNILITGGAGFIPSSLADKLLENPDYFVVLVDNFLTGRKENIPQHPNCKFIHGNVNNFDDIAPIFSLYNFDYVFHYAAVVGVKRTLENPIMVLDDIYGIRNILDLSKRTGVRRVFYSSSSEVYGEPVHLPQHETITPLNSRLPYAVVKNVGESYFRSYHQEYGLDYTIFRFFNTYGPKQSTDFVMSRFIRLALANKDIPIYGDGTQTRTFCFIEDHLDACIKAMESDLIVNDVANIGNGDIVTIMELAETIIRLTNSQSKIIHLPPLEEGDMTRRQPDTAKMSQLLGRPFTSLEKGIQIILNNLR
ncbi:NAD-dependent epimerase/dehydratase family protein [uncultured Fluviicola sp.]|uniref:NAD-dependent epimerase/dehydratase family protein n=1 Tax=uncultured Fluviicola sp. TaxID=463303 RepID=UPI0025CE8A3C|nr:NAD-dependent epimerase/dehydratase family protein [uncultured Fluviicola sp.]